MLPFTPSVNPNKNKTHPHTFKPTHQHSHSHNNNNNHTTTMTTTTSPSPSPSPSPVPWTPNSLSKPPVCFTPPLIAMLVIIATAFIIITYSRAISRQLILIRSHWRQWRRRRRLLRSYDIESPSNSGEQPYDPNYGYSYGYHMFSRYGLDDAVIKTIPVSVHTRKASVHECAVCLLEFEDDDYVRTLPVCFHAFHVECIDIWLKCHANCPLCRSSIFRLDSPFIPVMSARIRPNFDDVILDPSPEVIHSRQRHSITGISDITRDVSVSPTSNYNQFDDRFNRRDLLLKRSYSFGFERSLVTSPPWRHRRGGSLWCKRPSPTKTRVFSFRYSRRMKSPFFRRRSISFLPVTEYSGSSRRRINSGVFSSSRLRSGDPEALLSPDRYNRRLR